MKFIKNNFKLIIAFILGLIFSGTVAYATGLFDSTDVNFDNTTAQLKKTDNSNVTNVQEAIEAINRKIPPTCTTSPFKLGDYVEMTPSINTSTSISGISGVSGSITPSELNLWRVIRINSDCTVEMVSEYVSSTHISLAGKAGYKNYVYGLNVAAKKYANTTYTLDPSTAPNGAFRNVGYDGQTEQITDETKINSTNLANSTDSWYNNPTPLNGEESKGGGDNYYFNDLNLLKYAGVSTTAYSPQKTRANYMIAGRTFAWWDSGWEFYMYYISANGVIDNTFSFGYWGSFMENTNLGAVRPIITLKSGLQPSSGSGTSSSHYTLS